MVFSRENMGMKEPDVIVTPTEVKKCPECKSTKLIKDYERGEVVCGNCGLIITQISLDRGPEWRAFALEEREARKRVGVPTSYSVHDKGLPTVISHIGQDAFGRKLPPDVIQQMYRLRKLQYRAHTYDSFDRNLAQAMLELDRLSSALSIPDSIKEKAALIYRKTLREDLVRGRSIAAITAAALYAACRLTDTPRSLSEIASVSKVRRGDVARCYRLLVKVLGIRMPVPNPISLIPKIASKIGADSRIQQRAIDILKLAKGRRLVVGKAPTGLAAAALYIACVEHGLRKTQREIAVAASVTEVTLRNRYKSLKNALELNA
jgi:transcription initiation factor TFIIB